VLHLPRPAAQPETGPGTGPETGPGRATGPVWVLLGQALLLAGVLLTVGHNLAGPILVAAGLLLTVAGIVLRVRETPRGRLPEEPPSQT
jgi:hypothetical protein